MKRTQIYLDEDQTARLDERAAESETTRSELIRQAVHAYLDEDAGDEAARMARFRAAVEDGFGRAPDLPRGEAYVRELRSA